MSDKLIDLTNKEDEDLMLLYQNGSVLAFNEIYNRHSCRIYSFLYKKTSKQIVAEELTQEVFLKLHRSKALYNRSLPFSPWLFSISRSVFLDFLKKKSLEQSTPPEDLNRIADQDMNSNLNISQLSIDLSALKILPDTQEKVVSMRIIDEATFNEIASKLNTTPENARQIFSRAIRKIRNSFLGKE